MKILIAVEINEIVGGDPMNERLQTDETEECMHALGRRAALHPIVT